jgi:hypothetical protein
MSQARDESMKGHCERRQRHLGAKSWKKSSSTICVASFACSCLARHADTSSRN